MAQYGINVQPTAPPVTNITIDHQLQSGQHELALARQNSGELEEYQDNQQFVQQKSEAQPAFDGAKFDVNGFCVRHGKVRLCHPVVSKGGEFITCCG